MAGSQKPPPPVFVGGWNDRGFLSTFDGDMMLHPRLIHWRQECDLFWKGHSTVSTFFEAVEMAATPWSVKISPKDNKAGSTQPRWISTFWHFLMIFLWDFWVVIKLGLLKYPILESSIPRSSEVIEMQSYRNLYRPYGLLGIVFSFFPYHNWNTLRLRS